MITASYVNNLLEEYHALMKFDDLDIPIFVNPTRSEFREVGSDVRFIADAEEKKVYVWDASKVIHRTMKYFLGLDTVSPTMFWGEADKRGDNYLCVDSDSIRTFVDFYKQDSSYKRYIDKFLSQDWSWVNKYIDMDPYIQEVREHIKDDSGRGYLKKHKVV